MTAALTIAARHVADGVLARSLRGATEIVDSVRVRRPVAAPFTAWIVRRRSQVVVAAVVLAVGGWALETQLRVVSDLPSLVPSSLASVRNLNTLQHDTGVSGEVDVVVQTAHPRPDAAVGDRVDAKLRGRRAQARRHAAAPRAVAVGSVHDAAVGVVGDADPGAAERDAAVCVAGGDHA